MRIWSVRKTNCLHTFIWNCIQKCKAAVVVQINIIYSWIFAATLFVVVVAGSGVTLSLDIGTLNFYKYRLSKEFDSIVVNTFDSALVSFTIGHNSLLTKLNTVYSFIILTLYCCAFQRKRTSFTISEKIMAWILENILNGQILKPDEYLCISFYFIIMTSCFQN